MLKPSNLSPGQTQAYKDILKKKVLGLSSDCGFGKTVVGYTAFAVLLRKHTQSKMLIVCTPEGVKKTWAEEHRNWSHLNHLRVMPLAGTPKQRLKLLQTDADAYAISYNSLKWLLENNKGKHKVDFNFVFADEGDCLKGASSSWRALLLKVAPKAVWRVISSATPKTREEDDYWGLCKYLDNGKCLGTPNVGDFRYKYCKSYTPKGKNIQLWSIRKDMIPELEAAIAPLFIKYALSESATIPIKTITHYASLSPDSREKYDLLVNTQCVNSVVFNGVKKDMDKSLDASVLSGKLAQLSNGFVYVDDNLRITPEMLAQVANVKSLLNKSTSRVAVDVFDDRIEAFRRLMDRIYAEHGGDTRVIIPYFFKHELVQLKRVLPDAMVDTDGDFQNRWNDGENQHLLLQYNRSSKSLNLQNRCYVMALYSPTWKWVDDYQIVRRIARQGQPEPVVYAYRLHMIGTMDENKTKRLDERFKGHWRFQKKILHSLAPPLTRIDTP